MRRVEVRVEDELYDELLRLAEAQDRSLNWTVASALRKYVGSTADPIDREPKVVRTPNPRPDHLDREVQTDFKGGKR